MPQPQEIEPIEKGDDADRAGSATEIALGMAVNAIRNAPPEAQATGACLWCEVPLQREGAKFCDPECAHAWHDQRKRDLAFGGVA